MFVTRYHNFRNDLKDELQMLVLSINFDVPILFADSIISVFVHLSDTDCSTVSSQGPSHSYILPCCLKESFQSYPKPPHFSAK